METTRETYYVDFGGGTTYYHVVDGSIVVHDKKVAISLDRLLDFIATAKELGHRAGRL